MDRGLNEARSFIREQLLRTAAAILEDRAHLNFKSLLQEYVQAKYKTHPRYRVVTEIGPDHMKLFTVEVSVRGILLGKGQGHNKKEAEQSAAGDALARLRENEGSSSTSSDLGPAPSSLPPPAPQAGDRYIGSDHAVPPLAGDP